MVMMEKLPVFNPLKPLCDPDGLDMFSSSQCPNFPQDKVPTLDRIGEGPTGFFGKAVLFTFFTALSQRFFKFFFEGGKPRRTISGKLASRLVFLATGREGAETIKSGGRGPNRTKSARPGRLVLGKFA